MTRIEPDLDLARRAAGHWLSDGFVELAFGVLLIGTGALLALPAFVEAPWARTASAVGLPVWIAGGPWLAGRLVRTTKERVTYPVTGYVEYDRAAVAGRLILLLAALIAVGALAMSNALPLAAIPIVVGGALAAGLSVVALRTGVGRVWLVSLVAAVATLPAAQASHRHPLNVALLVAAVGAASLIMAVRGMQEHVVARRRLSERDRG
jgi:hypothetical protein